MDVYTIQGGRPLAGEVRLSGAKNLASKLLLASLLTTEECVLENVPDIGENQIALQMLTLVGSTVQREDTTVRVRTMSVTGNDLTSAARNRLSILAIPPLMFRTGRAVVARPGGDKIGKRPVDFHIEALRALGASVHEDGERYIAEARSLHGAAIRLPYPSVGATETVLLAGAWADGITTLENAAVEPEILELVAFLRQLGVKIEQSGVRSFVLQGTPTFGGARQRVIPDRLEAVSYANAALATRGEIRILDAEPTHLRSFEAFVRGIGGFYETTEREVRVGARGSLSATNIRTEVYPGFVTDWQQPSAVTLLTADGVSTIHETVMDDRFGYASDLVRMGANITVSTTCPGTPCRFNGTNRHVATIHGPQDLIGIQHDIPDIRAGMAQVIASLVADGESTLTGIEHLDRGYGRQLEGKLRGLGATIRRSSS